MFNDSIYLALGSNLNEPVKQLENCLFRLNNHFQIQLIQYSSIYKSPPFDQSDQPDYYNLVCEINSSLSPIRLLHTLQIVEKQQGRFKNKIHWGARIIDIDILLYKTIIYQSKQLTIPHNGLKIRNFFIIPLIEISDKNLIIPNAKKLQCHLGDCDSDLQKIKTKKQIKKSIDF